MKANDLEKILPFPKNGVSYRKDSFHVIPTKECFKCEVKKEGCDDPVFEKFPCSKQNVIIEFRAEENVKEVNFYFQAPGYHGLEIK